VNKDILDIQIFNGDDEIKYIKYDDLILCLDRAKEKHKELEQEIERLTKECIGMKNEIKEWCNKYSKLNNKRNEAIEYIENNDLYFQDYDYDYEGNMFEYPPTDEQAKQNLLEILKGEDNE
jgi:chromosome segregation ATPase